MTHSSPSRTARVRSVGGSEPGTSGSVIEKKRLHLTGDERAEPAPLPLLIRPEPHRISPFLPASGAWSTEYELAPERASDLLVQVGVDEEASVRATPPSGGRCGAHSPASFATARSRSTSASADSSSRSSTGSFG